MILFNKYSKNIWQTIFNYLNGLSLKNIKKIDENFQNFIENDYMLMRRIIKNTITQSDQMILYDPIILNTCNVIKQHPLNQCLQRMQSYHWSIYLYSHSEEYYNKIKNNFEFSESDRKFISEYSLIQIYKNNQFMFKKRNLNKYEKKLFKLLIIPNIMPKQNDLTEQDTITIFNKDEVIENMNTLYHYKKWKDFIPKNNLNQWKFFIAGGSLLSCIYKKYYSEIKNKTYINKNTIDVDLFMCGRNINGDSITVEDFYQGVREFVKKIAINYHTIVEPVNTEYPKYFKVINVFVDFSEKIKYFNNTHFSQEKIIQNFYFDNFLTVDAFPPKEETLEVKQKKFLREETQKNMKNNMQEKIYLKFQFVYIQNGVDNINSILHCFDLDCTQIGYDGNNFVCTWAFTQALATGTILNYELKNYLNEYVKKRINKYYNRGFNVLVPASFNINLWTEDINEVVVQRKELEEIRNLIIFLGNLDEKYSIRTPHLDQMKNNNDNFNIKKKLITILENEFN